MMSDDTKRIVQIVKENGELKEEIEKLRIDNWKITQDLKESQEETKKWKQIALSLKKGEP